jgi:hypothetical protein
MPTDLDVLEERSNFRTILGFSCFLYLLFMACKNSPTPSAVSTGLMSMSASFLAVWLFSIKEGQVKIKVLTLELAGPACEVVLWFAGVLVIAGTFAMASPKQSSTTDLERKMIGTWWSDDQWVTEPFSSLTIYDDGRFTRSRTNGQITFMPKGYWRVSDRMVLLTPQRDSLPVDSLQQFTVAHVTDHEMVLTNRFEGGQFRFTR